MKNDNLSTNWATYTLREVPFWRDDMTVGNTR